jgi:hypothetical protein
MRSTYQEIVMLLNEYRRLVAWFSRPLHKSNTAATTRSAASTSAFDIDPMWHGDHWQNLLSSPMDARHYVMEDWSVMIEPDFGTAGLATEIR